LRQTAVLAVFFWRGLNHGPSHDKKMHMNALPADPQVALDFLVGLSLNGWQVVREAPRDTSQNASAESSDGFFSRGFFGEKDGIRAFIKVLDFKGASEHGLPLDTLSFLLNAHKFEQSVLQACREARLANVVSLYDSGQCEIETPVGRQTVYFFALELAPRDVRHSIEFGPADDAGWKLRILHQTALALSQLHGKRICHQDVKPGNILDFDSKTFKLTDFGRAFSHVHAFPQANVIPFMGEMCYAPPEYAYGYTPLEVIDQREGADAYLLGSLIGILFCGLGATTMLIAALPEEMRPLCEPTPRFDEALPHLISAHGTVLIELAERIPPSISDRLTTAYQELTHPDPAVRGNPTSRREAGRRPGIERYVSLFDRLRHVVSVKQPKAAAGYA
jgi:eukaryotic-like serine/threonine-protein kinase